MGLEGICSCANGAVAEYTESLANRFLSFQCVRGAHPCLVYHNHGEVRPSGDYVRLKLFCYFFFKLARFIEN